jgi:elongation factor G
MYKDYLPSPLEGPPIVGTNKDGAKVFLERTSTKEGLCALAFKVIHDQHKGLTVYFRVYSGTIKSNTALSNMNRGSKEKPGTLYQVLADQLIPVAEVRKGDFGAVVGMKTTCTGISLCKSLPNPLKVIH